MTDSFTANQIAIAVAPKFTSFASFCGSAFIVYEILSDRKKHKCTFHRVLLGMCMTDFLSSFWFFLGTWPIPKGTPDVYLAAGNMGTCIAQGFFSQLSITTAYYNFSLAIYYALQIKLGWRPKDIAMKAEPFLHGMPLAIGLSTSFAGVALDSYNNDYWECWIAPFPTDCKETWKYGQKEANCIRGDNASLYRWLFYYMFLWIAILGVTLCMILVYRSVLKKEKALDRHGDPAGTHQHKFSHKVAVQGYWYCGAFYSTWFFPTITRLVQVLIGDKTPFWLICLTAMFVPIQGALNFVVYVRPRYKKYRFLRALARFRKQYCHCCKHSDEDITDADVSTSGGFTRYFYSSHKSPKNSNHTPKNADEDSSKLSAHPVEERNVEDSAFKAEEGRSGDSGEEYQDNEELK